MTSRERVLRHLNGEAVDRLPLMPITMMFAADCAGVPYGRYALDHRIMVEAQIRTAEEYGFDYVSVISDPAREAADLGAEVEYFDDQPPALNETRALLHDKRKLLELTVPEPLPEGRMLDRVQGVALLRERCGDDLLVEGWIEGPCAQGADLRGINNLMMDFYDDAGFVDDLFDFVVALELAFARAQVDAGADIIGMGDAAASLVSPDLYRQHVWPREKQMVEALHGMGSAVRLHICGDTRHEAKWMGELGCEIVDLDFLCPVDHARAEAGPEQVLLGNIDPVSVLRNSDPETVTAAIAECHRQAGRRFIVGAGCEVPRDTPPENLRAMCEYAHAHRPEDAP